MDRTITYKRTSPTPKAVYRGAELIGVDQDAAGALVVRAGTTVIGKKVACGRTSLTSITLPAGVTSIGDQAFCNCINLTSIAIPDGASVGEYAFYGCANLHLDGTRDLVTAVPGAKRFLETSVNLWDDNNGWGYDACLDNSEDTTGRTTIPSDWMRWIEIDFDDDEMSPERCRATCVLRDKVDEWDFLELDRVTALGTDILASKEG